MSITQLTDVQICKEALKRLGVTTGFPTAVDGTDTSKYGQLVYPTYYLTRDEEVRQDEWLTLRKQAQVTEAQVTDTACSWTNGSTTVTVTDTTNIKVGWVLGTGLIQGNPPALPPAGIPAGATVSSITDGTHLVISAAATANGSGQIVFQIDNETGYLFAYEAPSDMLFLIDLYAVYPAAAMLWPFQYRHTLNYPFKYQNGYIFTDIDTSSGNPIADYLAEPSNTTGSTPNLAADFTEALIMRLAGKLALPVTQDLNIKKDVNGEYAAVQVRARGTNAVERKNRKKAEGWWRP